MVCIDDIVLFVKENLPNYAHASNEEICAVIDDHMKYGTISIVIQKDVPVALMRVNIDGHIAMICDFIIAPGHEMKPLMRMMTLELWERFPYVKYFEFYRILKYPLKKSKIYSIKRLFKIN